MQSRTGEEWVGFLSGPNPFPSDLRVLWALCVKQLASSVLDRALRASASRVRGSWRKARADRAMVGTLWL